MNKETKFAITMIVIVAIAVALSFSKCHSQEKPVLFILGANVGFTYQLTPSLKAGIWHNEYTHGPDIAAGYQNTILRGKNYKSNDKDDFVASGFVEAGYHVELTNRIMAHAYLGKNSLQWYGGGDIFYRTNSNLLLGAGYRQRQAQITFQLEF